MMHKVSKKKTVSVNLCWLWYVLSFGFFYPWRQSR